MLRQLALGNLTVFLRILLTANVDLFLGVVLAGVHIRFHLRRVKYIFHFKFLSFALDLPHSFDKRLLIVIKNLRHIFHLLLVLLEVCAADVSERKRAICHCIAPDEVTVSVGSLQSRISRLNFPCIFLLLFSFFSLLLFLRLHLKLI